MHPVECHSTSILTVEMKRHTPLGSLHVCKVQIGLGLIPFFGILERICCACFMSGRGLGGSLWPCYQASGRSHPVVSASHTVQGLAHSKHARHIWTNCQCCQCGRKCTTSTTQQRLPDLPSPLCPDLIKEIVFLIRIVFVAKGATRGT